MLLPLGPERTHVKPSRVAEHECLDFRFSDLDQLLLEVDLQLLARRRLASSPAPPPLAPGDRAARRAAASAG